MKSCDRKSGTEQPFTVDSQGFENDATPGSEFALAIDPALCYNSTRSKPHGIIAQLVRAPR